MRRAALLACFVVLVSWGAAHAQRAPISDGHFTNRPGTGVPGQPGVGWPYLGWYIIYPELNSVYTPYGVFPLYNYYNPYYFTGVPGWWYGNYMPHVPYNPAPKAPAPDAPKPPEVKPPPPKPQEKKDDADRDAAMYKSLRNGNSAFASGNYSTAVRSYEQAQAAAPLDPLPTFHLGQAYLAQGKYAGATAAIQRGLKWQPGWPNSAFRPRSLYGERTAAYDQHLAQLAAAAEKNPNDDSLLFLLGYQLWFDGERDKALVLFQRAAGLRIESPHVDRFLKAAAQAGQAGGQAGQR
jgi:hypothetical protein